MHKSDRSKTNFIVYIKNVGQDDSQAHPEKYNKKKMKKGETVEEYIAWILRQWNDNLRSHEKPREFVRWEWEWDKSEKEVGVDWVDIRVFYREESDRWFCQIMMLPVFKNYVFDQNFESSKDAIKFLKSNFKTMEDLQAYISKKGENFLKN